MRVHGIAGLPPAAGHTHTICAVRACNKFHTVHVPLLYTAQFRPKKWRFNTDTTLTIRATKSAIRKLKCARDTIRTVHVQLLYTDKFRPKHERFNLYTVLTVKCYTN